MIHQELKSGDSFGININSTRTHVLLQLNDASDGEQVRVSLTSDEVNAVIQQLKENQSKIKCSVDNCRQNSSLGRFCLDHYLDWLFR